MLVGTLEDVFKSEMLYLLSSLSSPWSEVSFQFWGYWHSSLQLHACRIACFLRWSETRIGRGLKQGLAEVKELVAIRGPRMSCCVVLGCLNINEMKWNMVWNAACICVWNEMSEMKWNEMKYGLIWNAACICVWNEMSEMKWNEMKYGLIWCSLYLCLKWNDWNEMKWNEIWSDLKCSLYLCLKWNEVQLFYEIWSEMQLVSVSQMKWSAAFLWCKFGQHVPIQQWYEGWNNMDIKVKKVMKAQHI
jgi:hypothetical protein